jgi:hypothetical protein
MGVNIIGGTKIESVSVEGAENIWTEEIRHVRRFEKLA